MARFDSDGARWEYGVRARQANGRPFAEVIRAAPVLSRALRFTLAIDGRERYRLLPQSELEREELVEAAGAPEADPRAGTARVAVAGRVLEGDNLLPRVVVEDLHVWTESEAAEWLDPVPPADAGAVAAQLWRGAENLGRSPDERALNFALARSEPLWATIKDRWAGGARRFRVFTDASRLAVPGRHEVNVVLAYRPSGQASPEYCSQRIDVTEVLPFPTDRSFRPYNPKREG